MSQGDCVLGIDIGGTFTDVIALDAATGEMTAAKSPTIPGAIVSAIHATVAALGLRWDAVRRIVHGSTICTNALIEHTHAPTGFIGTQGFSDEFDIQRMVRRWASTPQAAVYDFHQRKPDPFIPRHLRREVNERVAYPGVVLEELDAHELAAQARELVAQGVRALAVCFLWSSANPSNERRAKQVLEREHPDCHVSISAEVAPVVREYERMVTTAVNASLMPVISDYLTTLEHELERVGFTGELLLMQSHGGVGRPSTLASRPVSTLRSGPVGGAVAAATLARSLERRTALACDIGGTSCDTTLIEGFEVPLTDRTEVEYHPILVPTADIRCIGAGGGSIAHLDAGGALRVGPESAGSVPGPACYGRGGLAPTLTDANVVLGRLGTDALRAAGIELSEQAAHASIRTLAASLGRDVVATAEAIITVAVANMADSVRLQTVDRGHDPRALTLIAFGGAGPLHATLLAEACAIDEVVIPREPGTFSAFGMVAADRAVAAQASFLTPLASIDVTELQHRYAAMEDDARAMLNGSGSQNGIEVKRRAAMRYELQEWELRVELPHKRFDSAMAPALAAAFHETHRARYGFAREDKPVELVTLYLDASVSAPPAQRPRLPAHRDSPTAVAERREVHVGGQPGAIAVAVYERSRLGAGAELAGPCIVQERTATTFIHPGWSASVDEAGNLIARREAAAQ